MITAENVTKCYDNGKTQVLRGVSLEIADGAFTVVLGASGSGKSTLMNALSGLEKADGGKITANGFVLTEMHEKALTAFRRKYVGFIFQQYYLLPHLDVLDNVKLGANLAGEGNCSEIIEALGLQEKLHARPAELSGGEQQRVCIARALAKRPSLLFLDEPTGALDEATGREVLDYIMKEKARLGFTMIMVTHNKNIADMADTVIGMNSGRITEISANAEKKTAYEIGW